MRRRLRRAIVIGAGFLLLVGLYLGANFVDVWATARQDYEVPDDDSERPVALVLGAAQYAGEPSPALQGRLDRAVLLYQDGAVDTVVVTGGSQAGDETTEAKASYDYLRSVGVPDEQILLEVDGHSTYESLAAAARFLRQRDITSVVLVTDPYHARRSLLVADEVGLEAEVALTDASSPAGRLGREALAVSAGRLFGFGRLDRYAQND